MPKVCFAKKCSLVIVAYFLLAYLSYKKDVSRTTLFMFANLRERWQCTNTESSGLHVIFRSLNKKNVLNTHLAGSSEKAIQRGFVHKE